MAEIIDFGKAKAERTPHASGLARCVGCSHEWTVVAPLGTLQLECPECKTMKGVFAHPYRPEVYLQCECGNTLFYATENGVFCPNCAQEGDHLDDN